LPVGWMSLFCSHLVSGARAVVETEAITMILVMVMTSHED